MNRGPVLQLVLLVAALVLGTGFVGTTAAQSADPRSAATGGA